jgi:hypothetical protein
LGSPVGCVVAFFASRFMTPKNEDSLNFMNINNMSLGALNPLHVYVRHDVELMEETAASESDGTLDFIPIKF